MHRGHPKKLFDPIRGPPRLYLRHLPGVTFRPTRSDGSGFSQAGTRGCAHNAPPHPPIIDETFPDYQTALVGLPEEPTPVTLSALTGQFNQPEDMDAKEALDLAADPPVTQLAAASLPLQTGGDPPPQGPYTVPLPTPTEEGRRAAMTAFLKAPRLGDAAHTHLEDVSILLHLFLNTPGRLIAFSRILPPIPSADATRIWEAWSPHLAHEETLGPNGCLASDYFTKILTSSPTNPGEQA